MIKELKITVNGKVYEVLVEIFDKDDHKASSIAHQQISSTAAQQPFMSPSISPDHVISQPPEGILSPLAGRVISISVREGQTVKKGDQLLVLEAMKMNNYVYAPFEGKIAAIYVKIGDAVENDQLLLNISHVRGEYDTRHN